MHSFGIDLAKASFDLTLLSRSGKTSHHQFPTTPAGLSQLDRWLKPQRVTQLHACMEATTVYWEALALLLHQRGYTVSVVNPARIKGYAQSQMQRNKTDKLDSATIAAFCAAHQLEPWRPPSAAQRSLRALVRHRDDLIATRIQLTNRLQDTSEPAVQAWLESLIATLKAHLTSLQQQITAHLKANADLAEAHGLMDTLPGIGPVTAQKVLAEFYDLANYRSAKAAAADAGVRPATSESGSSVRRRARMSKLGKAGMRGGLYWPALTVLRCGPEFKAYAARLAAGGKSKGVIVGAVMRKLVHILYGVVKHKSPYNPTKVLG